jgi:NAD(P) transhydrogenase
MYDFDLICIGSGPAGQRAAVQAAKLGHRSAVVEQRHSVGGVCIETGTIPSKTFREAVRSFMRPASPVFGQPLRPRPTMAELSARVNQVVQRELEIVGDQLGRNEVTLLRGRARFVDPHTVRLDSPDGGRTVTAERFLIGVGTVPCSPPDVQIDGRTIVTSDGILGLPRLPRSLAVVGGGVIGIEYACMFAALGVHVTVVDRRARPLEFLDGEITDELIQQMRRELVTFRCGEGVESIDVVDQPRRAGLIRLESGKHLVAEVVLFSVGRVGATADLGLQTLGLEADDRGRLRVDEHFRTDLPHVYAAGDVIGFPALAATSSEQGRLAACHMFGVEVEPMGSNFPYGIYAIPEISMVGATEEELTRAKVPYESGVARFREIARGQILGDDSGLLKLLFHRETRQLLGVHCIGTQATELVHVGQAVMALGGGLDYFLKAVFNYPTLAECYKVAAYQAHNKLRYAQLASESSTRQAHTAPPAPRLVS